jgi:5-amino-6-(5-phosphoribosylamino)uracil reductase
MAETPTAVLISRSFDIPWGAPLFDAADQPVIVYTGARGAPPEVSAPVEVVWLDDPAPGAVMADLRARGIRSLLCEGGPTLNEMLLAEGVVDELFLCVAPLLAGGTDAPTIVVGRGLPEPAAMELVWAYESESHLLLRYRLNSS